MSSAAGSRTGAPMRSATTFSRAPGGILQAHPPPCAYEVSREAIETMTTLNDVASRDALAAGVECATDVTGFGLLGHLYKMARASGVSAVIDPAAVPYLEGARQALADGYVSGGTRRNLDWVRPHLAADVDEDELLLLADAQTSGGLLVAGEIPGGTVIGELVPAGDAAITVR